jgi:hypothetical protein
MSTTWNMWCSVFIVAYITLKVQFEIKSWHILHNAPPFHNPNFKLYRFWGFLGICLYAYGCSMFLQYSCSLLAPLLWKRQFQGQKFSSSRTHYVEDPCHECDGRVLFVRSCLLMLPSGDSLLEVIDLIQVVTTSTLGFKDLSFHAVLGVLSCPWTFYCTQ